MKYWLCVTNEENWEVIKKQKIWGVSERYRGEMEKVALNDVLVFFVKARFEKGKAVTSSCIAGISKVISDPFQSTEKIFSSYGFPAEERFPHRVKIKSEIIPEKTILFRELIPKLEFITNKKMWTGHVRRAMRTISKNDYETIKKYLSK